MLIPVLALAQEKQIKEEIAEKSQGTIDGELAARGNLLWFFAGLGLRVMGVEIAKQNAPSPPVEAFAGKSSEYIFDYSRAFKDRCSELNGRIAYCGCMINGVVLAVFFYGVTIILSEFE